jgi:hypothetical protein
MNLLLELESDDESEEEMKKKKPPSTRLILESEGLTSILAQTSRCLRCYSLMHVSLETVCLATSIMLECKNESCGFVLCSDPPSRVTLESRDNRVRSTDFAINSLYILSFLSCGDGCTEAGRVLGLLGLPSNTTMERHSFGIIENRLSSKLQSLNDQLLEENLTEEVRLSIRRSTPHDDNNDLELWKLSIKQKNVEFSKTRYPKVSCSFDMGWQQWSSGQQYNSMSGHALLIGQLTRKPIAFCLCSQVKEV